MVSTSAVKFLLSRISCKLSGFLLVFPSQQLVSSDYVLMVLTSDVSYVHCTGLEKDRTHKFFVEHNSIYIILYMIVYELIYICIYIN